MTIVKDVVIVLVDGIPVWLKSVLSTVAIIIFGLWALGFDYQSAVDAKKLKHMRENSILLSKRANKDKKNIVDSSAKKVYEKLGDSQGLMGVSIISFEPEIQPKVLKVIARDGDKEFKKAIVVGSETYLSGAAMSLFLANREGINYMSKEIKTKILKDIGIKSIVSTPIIYRGICIGSMVLYFDREITDIGVDDYEYINGTCKIETHQILEVLYYSK